MISDSPFVSLNVSTTPPTLVKLSRLNGRRPGPPHIAASTRLDSPGNPSLLQFVSTRLPTLIRRAMQAVSLTPRGHPHEGGHLVFSLLRRFEHLGHMANLDEAVSVQKRAVQLTSDGHSPKPSHLTNLSFFVGSSVSAASMISMKRLRPTSRPSILLQMIALTSLGDSIILEPHSLLGCGVSPMIPLSPKPSALSPYLPSPHMELHLFVL